MPKTRYPESLSPTVHNEKRYACTTVRQRRTQSPREALYGSASPTPMPPCRRREPIFLTSLPAELLEMILSHLDCLSLASCHAASPVLAAVISSPCFLDRQACTKLHCPIIAFRDLPELSRFQELWYLTYCAANNPHMSSVLTRKSPTIASASPCDCNNDALCHRRARESPGQAQRAARGCRSRKKSPADEDYLEDCATREELKKCTKNKGDRYKVKSKKCWNQSESRSGSSRDYRLETVPEVSDSEEAELYVAHSECACSKFPMDETGGNCGITLCGRHATLHIGNTIHSLVSFLITAGCYPGKSRTQYPEPFFAHLPLEIREKPQAFAALVSFALAFPELLEIGQRVKIAKLVVHAGGPREFDATVESGWQEVQGDPALTLELVLLITTSGSVWLVLALAVYVTAGGGLTVWTGALSYITFGTRQTFSAHGFPPGMSPALLRQEMASSVLRILQPTSGPGLPAEVINRYSQVSLELPIFSSKGLLINALVSHIKTTVDRMDDLCKTRLELHELKALQVFLGSLVCPSKGSKGDSEESGDEFCEDGVRKAKGKGPNKWRKGGNEEQSKVYSAILDCLRRVVNNIFLEEVKWYLGDSQCHSYLCKHKEEAAASLAHPDSRTGRAPSCQDLSVHHLPYKVWPPHLLCQAGHMVSSIARVLELDIVLWLQGLHDVPLLEGAHVAFLRSLHHSGLVPSERDTEQWQPPLICLLQLQA